MTPIAASLFAPSLSVLAAFVATSLTLNVAPGADMMFVIAHTLSGGARAGRRAALGIALGSLIQALLAIAGISALIAASGGLLEAITYAGAAYLIWVGVRIVRAPPAFEPDAATGAAAASSERDANPFGRGVMTNLLNIKVVLFYVTLLPLFVRSSAGPEWQQVLFYGLLFNALGTCILLCVASGIDRGAYRLRSRPRLLALLSKTGGTVLIALAVTVLSRQVV
jgi:threonine/homoserine/homoserine lactone efflux protein